MKQSGRFGKVAAMWAPIAVIVVFFFENLERAVPDLKNVVLSPADGTIIDVKECREDRFFKETALKVRIGLLRLPRCSSFPVGEI